jgi:aromatic-L-amino-acid/L-tryptophan decarboxylase
VPERIHESRDPAGERPRHMTPEEFRRHGHAAVDWVASYLERLESFPVLAATPPGAVRAALPPAAPEAGEPFEAILADVERIILPGITHWQSPNFFAYFPANASPPAVLGDLISAGLGVQGMLWATSPACTELETHVLDWLADALALPEAFTSRGPGGGVIQDTASSATLCALLAARERALGGTATDGGLTGTLTAYASTQAHSSVEKAMGIAGLGRRQLRGVAVDGTFAMRPEALEAAITTDRAAGRTPCFAVATVGTTSSTAIDPVRPIAEICRRHGLWLHVDAALAGNAAVCPEFRHLHEGLDLADSYCVNPHKWLLTNFDLDCFYVADRAALVRALSILPEYLRNRATEAGAVIDYRDWQVPLGRRFRALKLWFVMRSYGLDGLRRHIRHHVALARDFADRVAADPRFEVVAPVPLNLVCFRLRGDDGPNERLLARLNDSGALFLTHTKLDGRFVLRLAIGGTYTTARHVAAAWERIRAEAAAG